MEGYLLIDKPTGISSFGVVAKVRRLITEATGQKIKIGHTGTLDPAASGLMILVLGKYTKKASQFSKLDKVYETTIELGATSSTADSEGQITKKSTHKPDLKDIETALNKFVGAIEQIPPAYSAIKVGGQRAYRLARAGKEVLIEPRMVQIYSIENVKYNYPKLSFTVHVSSGTYIRSLAEDLGKVLGTGAYLAELRRTKVGDLGIGQAIKLDGLRFEDIKPLS